MTKTINTVAYEKLKKELERWPKSWAGLDSDIPIGKEIIKTIHSFLSALMDEGYSKSTMNRHIGNLWLLGGEMISRIHTDAAMKDMAAEELFLRFVDEEGGPYSRHPATDEEQSGFDATCRKLYRFLSKKPDPM